jgi:hypothetical protein
MEIEQSISVVGGGTKKKKLEQDSLWREQVEKIKLIFRLRISHFKAFNLNIFPEIPPNLTSN